MKHILKILPMMLHRSTFNSLRQHLTCNNLNETDSMKNIYFFLSSEGYSYAKQVVSNSSIESSDVQLNIGIAFPLQGTSVGFIYFQ